MLDRELDKIWSGWKIDQLLGEGAFGKVYKISKEEYGHVYEAALKVIRIPQNQSEVISVINDGMDEKSVAVYFNNIVGDIVKEIVLMNDLKGNTNIVSYEDHRVVADKNGIGWTIYIRMELLTPLFNFMRNKSMTLKGVARLGIDMCSALEVCQRERIIHRDIKPENIFITKNGNYKLGDFGISRQMEKNNIGLSKKGTFTYMAPEVYKGEIYDHTVDIYSLGIVLYRFLNNNRTPFLPAFPAMITPVDRENANVKRISGCKMERPCNGNDELVKIVLKACAYDPKERYQNAGEMKKDLQKVLNAMENEVKTEVPKPLIQENKAPETQIPEPGTRNIFEDEEDVLRRLEEEKRRKEEERRRQEEERRHREEEKRRQEEERQHLEEEKKQKEEKPANKMKLIIAAAIAVIAIIICVIAFSGSKKTEEPDLTEDMTLEEDLETETESAENEEKETEEKAETETESESSYVPKKEHSSKKEPSYYDDPDNMGGDEESPDGYNEDDNTLDEYFNEEDQEIPEEDSGDSEQVPDETESEGETETEPEAESEPEAEPEPVSESEEPAEEPAVISDEEYTFEY